MHILHTVLYKFPEVLTRRICHNQELLSLVIISFILATSMCDSKELLEGEVRCWSLVGGQRVNNALFAFDTFTNYY